MRPRLLVSLLLLALLVAACSTDKEQDGATVEIDDLATQAFTTDSYTYNPEPCGFPVEVLMGVTWTGAEFQLFRPTPWNGKLIVYAHGYIDPSEPVGFPDDIPQDLLDLQDFLLCNGFALAASSYSANGLAIEEGILDTHLLNPLFWWYFEEPVNTYVMGHSMGGIISLLLAEAFPWRYDGAVPMCGPVDGSLRQLDYIGHVRVLFDVFLDDFLAPGGELFLGSPSNRPTRLAYDEVEEAIRGLLESNPEAQARLLELATVVVDGVRYHQDYVIPHPILGTITIPNFPVLPVDPGDYPFPPPPPDDYSWAIPSLTNSLLAALRYFVVGAQDVLDRGGGSPFDNWETEYAYTPLGTGTETELDVAPRFRFKARQNALSYWSTYVPSGNLLVPTVTIHNVGDPDVPVVHEDLYADRVWIDPLLTTVKLPSYGHCNFPTIDVLPPDLFD